jgi:hypothetical protein
MRQLRLEAGLTWREIAARSYLSHTTFSQNADGRLTPTWAPVHAWFMEFYRAVEGYEDSSVSMPCDEAIRQARQLWKACRAHQKALHRSQVVPTPPALTPSRHHDLSEIDTDQLVLPQYERRPSHAVIRHDPRLDWSATPRSRRRRPQLVQRPTIPMPGRNGPMEELKLCTPDSLYRATSVSDIVASLNDALTAAGFDISQLFRRGRLTPRGGDEAAVRRLFNDKVREALTGRYPPTPAIIQRVITACAGTARDRREWEIMTTPLLAGQPARGQATVPTSHRHQGHIRRPSPGPATETTTIRLHTVPAGAADD